VGAGWLGRRNALEICASQGPFCTAAVPPACTAQIKRRATLDRSLSAADEAIVPMERLGESYARWVADDVCG
jgi:hypothetical protein